MFIKEHSNQIVGQLSFLIQQLKKDEFVKPLEIFSNNTVSKHVRHILEFYQCLFNGVDSGIIDYDNRKRDIRLETDLDYVLKAIEEIIDRTNKLSDSPLKTNVSYGDSSQVVNSNSFRELVYNIEHTVHHLAIIKIGLNQAFPHIVIPENLGVADSTIKYQQQSLVIK